MATSGGETYRLYDGITAYVSNPSGKEFQVTLEARDLNVFESRPTEVLLKVYKPDGQHVVREVIPDDGPVSRSYLPRFAGRRTP